MTLSHTHSSSSGNTLRTLGGFMLERELGRGGMGAVFLARSPQGLPVALKVLFGHGLHDVESLARFAREGQVGALRHPHLTAVYHCGRDQGHPFLVLEYVHGASLADRLRRGPLAPDEAARVGLAVAKGLAHLHAHGIVHRDLKPENVLIGDDGSVKVTDFGIAAVQAQTRERLTQTGELLGTPAYMAPEQALDTRRVDARTDLYSWGATLHCALTGAPPFTGPSALAVLDKVVSEPPPPLPKEVPRDLAELIAQCLAKDPDKRPAVEEVLERLVAPAASPTRTGHGAWRWAGVLLGVSGLAVGVGIGSRPSAEQVVDAEPEPTPEPSSEPTPDTPSDPEDAPPSDFEDAPPRPAPSVAEVQGLLLEGRTAEAQALLAETPLEDADAQAALTCWARALAGEDQETPPAVNRRTYATITPLWALAGAALYEQQGRLGEALRIVQCPQVRTPELEQRQLELHRELGAQRGIMAPATLDLFVDSLNLSMVPEPLWADALTKHPHDGHLSLRRGEWLRTRGEALAALEHYRHALNKPAPVDGLEVRRTLAALAHECNRPAVLVDALWGWQARLEARERHRLARCLTAVGRAGHAQSILRQLLREQPEEWRYVVDLGRAQWQANELEQALESFALADRLTGGAKTEPGKLRALVLQRSGREEEAHAELARLRDRFPNNARLATWSGWLLLRLRLPQEALEAFERARALSGGAEEPRLQEGFVRAYEELGRHTDAAELRAQLGEATPDTVDDDPFSDDQ